MSIEIVVAISNNYAIGKDNKLLWHIPEDLQRFKRITDGHSVLMGRKTWESLPEKFRPLPNRENIVVSSKPDFIASGATVIPSLNYLPLKKKIFVIGGGEIYRQMIDFADVIHMTQVHIDIPDADSFFPRIELTDWKIVDTIDSSNAAYKYSFLTLKRK